MKTKDPEPDEGTPEALEEESPIGSPIPDRPRCFYSSTSDPHRPGAQYQPLGRPGEGPNFRKRRETGMDGTISDFWEEVGNGI